MWNGKWRIPLFRKKARNYTDFINQEFTDEGYRRKPDRITGGRTAIGRPEEGHRAASGHVGAPANGSDLPVAVRRRSASTHRQIEGAIGTIQSAFDGTLDWEAAAILIDALIHPDVVIADAAITAAIDGIRSIIPVVASRRLNRLKTLDTSSQEAEAVLVDEREGAVYKLFKVEDGMVTHGMHPGGIRGINPDGTGLLVWEPVSPTSVVDFFHQVDITNRQGGAVFTEIAALTDDGWIVLKQPYVCDLHALDHDTAPEHLVSRGFHVVLNMERACVAFVDDTAHLFVDLHGRNVMQTSEGHAFLVDSVVRAVTDEELERLVLS